MRRFYRIAVSNTINGGVTKYVTCIIFNQIYYILMLILLSKRMKNQAIMADCNTIKWWLVIVVYFFGPPCMSAKSKVFDFGPWTPGPCRWW